MVSSSPPFTRREMYDVFLSFRGEDTRVNFTSHLYAALRRKAIKTFIDDSDLKRGDEISAALLNAIEESLVSVVILSKDYASSKWCLDELAKILECKKMNGQMVIPIFYQVDPSDVRKQTGSFENAFVKHEKQFKTMKEKVHKWRAALTEVSNLSGWDSLTTRSESEFIDKVVGDIWNKLLNISSSSDFADLVGIGSRIEKIKSLLCIEESDFRMIGIWGMGGIGKTTIAGAVYNQIKSQFDGCCFTTSVKEESNCGAPVRLRKELLSQILGEDIKDISTPNLPPNIINILRRKKVLIVLDDVNDFGQLELLTGGLDWFSSGSRIIVTTRDKQVLCNHGVLEDNIYVVQGFNDDEALELFCKYAFKQDRPIEDFMVLTTKFVNYAKGNPLALKVLGSSLYRKPNQFWKSAMNKLKRISNPRIHDVLKISYDGLDEEEKNIFLDIACFFRGEGKAFASKILDSCYFSLDSGLSVLVDKSLVIISSSNKLEMHDLLQEIGWDIVRKESKEPGKRSRLWDHDDVYDVLMNRTGSNAIEGISLDVSKIRDVLPLDSRAFTTMCNLRYLELYVSNGLYGNFNSNVQLPHGLEYLSGKLRYLHWPQYPLRTLPSNFCPKNLVQLDMPDSYVEQLWSGTQDALRLKSINLPHSRHLIRLPDLSKATELQDVNLDYCTSLLDIPLSIQYLNNLTTISLVRCESLRNFPSNIHFGSLETLNLGHCISLTKFPHISGNVRRLYLHGTAIEEVPPSIECLTQLVYLTMKGCENLRSFPVSNIHLESLKILDLSDCINLTEFPQISRNVTQLHLDGTAIEEVPPSIEHLTKLFYLSLVNCTRLKNLPTTICKLESLVHLLLRGCSELESFPEILEKMGTLKVLDLSETAIKGLPSSIEHLNGLRTLDLKRCKNLETLPSSFSKLTSLKKCQISCCPKFKKLPENSGSLEVGDAERCALSQLQLQGSGFTGFVLPPLSGFLCSLKKLRVVQAAI